MSSRPRRVLELYSLCWWDYGASGWERAFRVLILAVVLCFLSLFLVTGLGHRDIVPKDLQDLLSAVPARLQIKEFAVALGITAAILAGACASFIAALAQHVVSTGPKDEGQIAPRAVMSLMVAFLAAVIATLTFGGLASISPDSTKLLHWSAMIAALVQLLSSAVLIVFTLVLVIPNYAHHRLADELVRALSWTWLIFFGLLALLTASAPDFRANWEPLILLALSVTMGQITVAHGFVRLSKGNKGYESFLDKVRMMANILFAVSAVVTTGFLLAILVCQSGNRQIITAGLYTLILLWSVALLFLQIWIEGTRKKDRYPHFPSDFLDSARLRRIRRWYKC